MNGTSNPQDLSIKLLSFDIDNTLIDLKTLGGLFTPIWNKYRSGNGLLLTYNSGRLYKDILKLISKKILPEPAYIIGGVGTHIYDFENQSVIKEFDEILDEGWDLSLVENTIDALNYPISIQPRKYQHSYKRSYFLEGASPADIQEIERIFGGDNPGCEYRLLWGSVPRYPAQVG